MNERRTQKRGAPVRVAQSTLGTAVKDSALNGGGGNPSAEVSQGVPRLCAPTLAHI